ncbi:3-dehydroquinate synthase [invertebrate metagenome]|uniref:3-dehydroquinate synthase n=1 Tax=invertebrate metagenome TaxID=1711999 RepID=A0A2H9T6P9_9ZZZZ
MQTLQVDLGERSYPIFIGSGASRQKDLLQPYIEGKQVAVVTNETIAPLYLSQLEALLEGYDLVTVQLPDGEKFKNLTVTNIVFDALLKAHHTRKTTLIALGGGVIGDITGFSAACYQRGVNFIQVPTTLLAQVDSSVGGKTGVNHALGKNMIGAFYQPKVVIIDTDSLTTLPDREFSAGLAEIIKYGLICDAKFYAWLQKNIDGLMNRDADLLAYAIHRSCEDKARVVAEDEKEAGLRAILNFGHTFGHAIENCMGYGRWLHGEAVAAGMVMAFTLSERMGMVSKDQLTACCALLKKAGLPVLPPEELAPDELMDKMRVDKKVIDGALRLVLLKDIGSAYVTSDFDHAALHNVLKSYLTH